MLGVGNRACQHLRHWLGGRLRSEVYTAEQLHAMGIVDVLVEDGEGVYGLRDYVKRGARRSNALRASLRARKRVRGRRT